MSHFEQRLEADLNSIRDWIWNLGEEVEIALRNAKKTLLLRDEELAYSTVLRDHPINRDSRKCDRLCHMFIARHLPGAGHLREMASTIRVNVALERIGDYAVTICREAMQLSGPLPEPFATNLDSVADESISILSQSRQSFRDGNAELATALMQQCRQVESKMDGVYENLMAADDKLDGQTMLAIFVVFSLLKRVADQAKNICDQTVYSVLGVAKIAKTHKILFLDQPGSGIGQLAVAIGRKSFAENVAYSCATPGQADQLSSELETFLLDKGLSEENLATEQLEGLAYDVSEFSIIISLNGAYSDYLEKVPFHSTALNWPIEGTDSPIDRTAQYRNLRANIDNLVNLVVGDEALGA